jgi:hypothetical protein
MRTIVGLALMAGFATSSFCRDQPTSAVASTEKETLAASALARLRTLAGEWKGSFEWTGSRTGTGAMNATYYLTGNGSAVVENLTTDGAPIMTSVYHLDGADLRMTHYCAAQNQPRLKASRIDLAQGIVNFSFVDATNLSSPDAPHVHGFEMRLGDADHLTITFLFTMGGRESRERIALVRVKGAPANPSQAR